MDKCESQKIADDRLNASENAVNPGPPAPKRDTAALIAAYMGRHAEAKKQSSQYCYRHNPAFNNKRADNVSLQDMQKSLETFSPEDCQVISHIWGAFGAAPSDQRQVILRGILGQCCLPQLSEVASMIRELVRIDFISLLPIELSFKVLGYLDARSLSVASMVSKRWKQLADDDYVWYHLCEQHIDRKCTNCGWGLPLLDRKRLRKSKQAVLQRLEDLSMSEKLSNSTLSGPGEKRKRSEPLSGSSSPLELASKYRCTDSAPRKTRPWKEVYIERYQIENNWRNNRYTMQVFHHTSPVLCLQFDEQYLMTGTYDGHVNIWCVETGALVRTLIGHIRAISGLKFDNCKLVTGSWDQSVRVWNYQTGQCLCTFGGLDAKVLCIDTNNNLIAAGSTDATVKVWDFLEKSCFTLRGHTEPVHSVKIHHPSTTLYSTGEDMTVKMWDLKTKTCIRSFGGPNVGPNGHVAQIQQALPMTIEHLEGDDHHMDFTDEQDLASLLSTAEDDDDKANRRPTHLLTASLDNTIKLWDIKTGKCARTLFGHVEGVWCIAADNFRIVSGAHDKLVKVWDVQSGKCWHTFSGHTKPVCCVDLNDTGFASGGDDGIVQLYSFDN